MPCIREFCSRVYDAAKPYQQILKLNKYTWCRDNGYFAFRCGVLEKLLCQDYSCIVAVLNQVR